MQKSFRFRISVTFLIIFSILLPSASPLLAQEEVSEPIARQGLTIADTEGDIEIKALETVPADTKDTVVDENNTETDAPKESEDTTASDPASALAPVQPKIDTKIRPEVDETTGALRYSYPIEIPQGRSGMTPNLSLNYNSENKDNQSAFGYGWDLSIPYISRINKHGTNELYDRYDFVSSLDGELEKVNDTTYRAKIENGSFNQYIFTDNVWTLKTKDGKTYIFGSNNLSRQDDATQSKIYKWMLETEKDANSNAINYKYFKDQGQIYPEKINYTLSPAIGGIFEIEFAREARTDTIESYTTAFSVKTNYRVNEIQAKINGTQSRKYILDYTVGDNGARSVLSGITKSAVSESGIITTLPRVGFEYSKSGSTIYGDTTRLNTDELYASSDMNGLVAGDINGDAYPDMLKAYEYNCYNYFLSKKTFIFNPTLNLFQESSKYSVPESIINLTRFCYSKLYGGTRILDVNGDGKGDLMRTPNSNSSPAREINNGDSWIKDASGDYRVDYNLNTSWSLHSQDLNGDGLIDYIQDSPDNVSGWDTRTSINDGFGFEYVSNIKHHGAGTKPYSYTPVFTGKNDYAVFDINGDNLPDIVESTEKICCGWNSTVTMIQNVYINKGDSWYLDPSYVLPRGLIFYSINASGEFNQPFDISDFNNDGLNDILNRESIYINQGKSFVPYPISATLQGDLSSARNCSCQNPYFLFDINADGSQDYLIGNKLILNNTKTPTDVLKTINLSSGAKVDVSYKSSAQYKDSVGTLVNPKLPMIIQTVEKIVTTDPVNNISSTDTYTYADGRFYFDKENPFDRKFAGFGEVVKTANPSTSGGQVTKTYFHTGGSPLEVEYEKIGRVYKTEVSDNAGNIYERNLNKWETNGSFVKLTQTVNETHTGSSMKSKASSYTYDNTNGDVLTTTNHGEVASNGDGNFTDVVDDIFITTYTYSRNGNISKPQVVNTKDGANKKINEKRYYYDNLALGQISNPSTGSGQAGNLTQEDSWLGGSEYSRIKIEYNQYGLKIKDIDQRDNVTTYSYDSHNLYPASVTNALGHITKYEYDYNAGKVKKLIDPNQRIYETSYDGLGRVLEERQPGLGDTLLVQKSIYTYTDIPNAIIVKKIDYANNVSTLETNLYYDGLGRIIKEKRNGENGKIINRDFVYNNMGLLEKESLPYFVGDGIHWNSYAYDILERITAISNDTGTISNAYSLWDIATTDQNGNSKKYIKDAHDNVKAVEEINDAETYRTNYDFDGNKKLLKITDALGDIRNFTYDKIGRALTMEDLRPIGDSIFGVWKFVYDNASNVTKVTNPKEEITNFVYDKLNRPLSEDNPALSGIEVSYKYDTGADGVGRLTSVTSPTYTENNKYNSLGLPESITRVLAQNSYITSYGYDRLGNVLNITNPDNSKIKFEYNTAGLLENIQAKESNTQFTNVVNNFDYIADGRISRQENSNGTITENTYDSMKAYRLARKLTKKGENIIQDLNYTYDNTGNILTITDKDKSTTYTYDDLNRLLSATNAGINPYANTFSYNALGNITSFNGIPYTYDSSGYANPHAMSKLDNISYTYDKNGNLLTNGTHTYTWDYKNRLTTVQALPGQMTSYTYDYKNQRITTNNGISTTIYPTKYYNEERNKNGKVINTTKHIFDNNGNVVASINGKGLNAKVSYVHADHLGSTTHITDTTGQITETNEYLPYGSSINSSGLEQRKYIGEEYDRDTGLNYLNARYYNSQTGMFLSQDPLFWNLSGSYLLDPQQQNSYLYARGNPVSMSDPSGLVAVGGAILTVNKSISNFVNSLVTGNSNVAKQNNFSVNSTQDKNNTSLQNTKNGTVEYGAYNVTSVTLRNRLDRFANDTNQNVIVTSGDRSAERNKIVGGANASRHLAGDAADIKVNGVNNEQLSYMANQSGLFNTTIYYPAVDLPKALSPHVHVDLNPVNNNKLLIYSPFMRDNSIVNSYKPLANPLSKDNK